MDSSKQTLTLANSPSKCFVPDSRQQLKKNTKTHRVVFPGGQRLENEEKPRQQSENKSVFNRIIASLRRLKLAPTLASPTSPKTLRLPTPSKSVQTSATQSRDVSYRCKLRALPLMRWTEECRRSWGFKFGQLVSPAERAASYQR